MNRLNGARFVLLSVGAGLVLGSCALFAHPEPKDFEARDGDFAGYSTWALAAKTSGSSPLLGMAHDAKNPDVTRFIYVKDDAKRKDNGQFPVGTILVKQSKIKDGSLVGVATAMVKRAKGYNPDAGDWEWFMLEPQTGAIIKNAQGEAQRGKIGFCIACHTDASETDYSFTVK